MSAAWPLPEPNDPPPRRKLTLHQQRVIDSITNAGDRGGAADPGAASEMPLAADSPTSDQRSEPSTADREAKRIDWSLALEQSDLEPSDFDPPEFEPGPEWPDPSWHGFATGASERSYVLAVSPWFLERYPDKAWDISHILRRPGQARHHDPETDPEAEP